MHENWANPHPVIPSLLPKILSAFGQLLNSESEILHIIMNYDVKYKIRIFISPKDATINAIKDTTLCWYPKIMNVIQGIEALFILL